MLYMLTQLPPSHHHVSLRGLRRWVGVVPRFEKHLVGMWGKGF